MVDGFDQIHLYILFLILYIVYYIMKLLFYKAFDICISNWHLLYLWHKTDLGGPTCVIMQGLLSLFMSLILVGNAGGGTQKAVCTEL